MIPVFSHLRFFLYRQATDLRKSFDALSGIIRSELDQDPLSADVFVFINRRKDRIKLLVWDRDGFWLFYKRLEKGTFQVPFSADQQLSIQLSYDELLLILQGIDLASVKRRPRYHQNRK